MTPLSLVSDLLMSREPTCGSSRVVAIDGPSGAGKTTFAGELASALGAEVLHLDRLYEGWHGLETAPPKVAAMLAAVALGETGRADGWSWVRDQVAGSVLLPPAPVIVVEGVGAGAGVVRPFLTATVWIDGPEDERRHRALMRDGDTYAPWWDVWAEQERRHFAREGTRARADVELAH